MVWISSLHWCGIPPDSSARNIQSVPVRRRVAPCVETWVSWPQLMGPKGLPFDMFWYSSPLLWLLAFLSILLPFCCFEPSCLLKVSVFCTTMPSLSHSGWIWMLRWILQKIVPSFLQLVQYNLLMSKLASNSIQIFRLATWTWTMWDRESRSSQWWAQDLSGQTTIDGKRGMQLLGAIEQRIQSMFLMLMVIPKACGSSVMTQDGCPRTNGMVSGPSVKIGFLVKRPVFVRSGDYKVSCAYLLFFSY